MGISLFHSEKQMFVQRSRDHQKYQDGQKSQSQRTDKLVLCNRRVSGGSKLEPLPHGCKLPHTSQAQNISGRGPWHQNQTLLVNLWPRSSVGRQVRVDVTRSRGWARRVDQVCLWSIEKQQIYDLIKHVCLSSIMCHDDCDSHRSVWKKHWHTHGHFL